MVLDTETQKWDPAMKKLNVEQHNVFTDSVVMDDKIYMRNRFKSFVYEPKESKWNLDQMLNSEGWEDACVIEDVLYYYDINVNKLKAFDPKQRCWRVVRGEEEWLRGMIGSRLWSRTVSYGGKLALFFHKPNAPKGTIDVWCAEIALERRHGGEIWGKVQWCDHVVIGDDKSFYVRKCFAVMV
ncbi:unnamed protein product [Thlaspi arvense]|uniref:FKB95-like N-terminal Kelch domain-containing protein n=1 Tax=Thlaspi arvense TaxID=13288 RepID=A0AAU9SW90_THLAR|nr:unnamed protein product [Thlaspi arvense]